MLAACIILVTLAGLSGIKASATAQIDHSVEADVPTTVNLMNQSRYNATRILLSFYPPAWHDKSQFGKQGNQCLLIKETAIEPEANNTLSVTIPAAVAPPGALCALEFLLYNGPVTSRGLSGITAHSNDFALVDGTGKWSQDELTPDGNLMMSPERLLCEAVDCVRRCQDEAFPYQCRPNDLNHQHNSTAKDIEHECLRGCPGIRWPPISAIKSARAMASLTGGAGTPTRSTCRETTWDPSVYQSTKQEL